MSKNIFFGSKVPNNCSFYKKNCGFLALDKEFGGIDTFL